MSHTLRLILMRHGESPMLTQQDKERPLSARGRAQVAYVAERLQHWPERWRPQQALVSSARRTQETWALLSEGLGDAEPIHAVTLDSLYLADVTRWVTELSCLEEPQTVLCIGHNPGLSDLLGELSGVWTTLNTGELVGLKVKEQTSWGEALATRWRLEGRVSPIHIPPLNEM